MPLPVGRLAAESWGTDETAERRVGKGRVVAGELGMSPWALVGKATSPQKFPDLYCHYDVVAGVLARMGLPPDFESDANLRYPHRRDGRTDIYFVANPAEHRVQVMARVTLNAQNLGVLWKTPYQVEITGAAQRGVNTLEIVIANLWPNRPIGDQALPPEQRVAWTAWNPFKKDTPLLKSGLRGPVCYSIVPVDFR